jgi:hypothetical protein
MSKLTAVQIRRAVAKDNPDMNAMPSPLLERGPVDAVTPPMVLEIAKNIEKQGLGSLPASCCNC